MSDSLLRNLLFSTSVLLIMSCSSESPDRSAISPKKKATESAIKNTSDASGSTTLSLSWNAQEVTSYHVFYKDPQNVVREIDSLQLGDANFESPKLTIDNTNLEQWPEKGSKACFYVTAEYSSLISDPSNQVCIVL